MLLYKTIDGPVYNDGDLFFLLEEDWDELLNTENFYDYLFECQGREAAEPQNPLAPIGTQEVWACGVTYLKSRSARMEEAESAGGGDFYDRVYDADRPEIFFKAPHYRVKGPGEEVRIRADSGWDVPEPEFTLVVNKNAEIIGYTIGNDMSSRSIEGENPLYLPQAKSYDGSCAIGPAIHILAEPASKDIEISIIIARSGNEVFSGSTKLDQMKRELQELVDFLYRELSFPNGAYVMTGTGIVPENDFTLQSGDIISISIDGVGTLTNTVQ
ncbi:MAG: fumarylacetoacetate hydrolase family protein [Lentisphaeria bacterium]|nr:fumarylacetoacetate hydrolase family protein [Lentisphaeria bacterium]NQZ67863.1 fumarylacetoacetate hydrolase family protein [Lentisphaeria bacterium]